METGFRHSGRFYRNWLIFALVLVACFAAILVVRYSPLHLIWVLPFCYLGLTLLRLHSLTHPRFRLPGRPTPPDDAGLSYEQVEFASQDGVRLAGWFVPGRNRAAVILAHPFKMQGAGMSQHAAMLVKEGYGVLMLDLRAHGASAGDTCTLGWLETYDVLGALDYVQGRDDVDAGKIGVLGISLGARAALRAAAHTPAIGGVVADGPGPGAPSDHGGPPATPGQWVRHAQNRLNYALLSFLNGVRLPPGLLAVVRDIAPRPVLLISTGDGGEQAWVRTLYRAALEPKELWELPEAGHGGGYLVYPQLYAQRIVAFFDKALLGKE